MKQWLNNERLHKQLLTANDSQIQTESEKNETSTGYLRTSQQDDARNIWTKQELNEIWEERNQNVTGTIGENKITSPELS